MKEGKEGRICRRRYRPARQSRGRNWARGRLGRSRGTGMAGWAAVPLECIDRWGNSRCFPVGFTVLGQAFLEVRTKRRHTKTRITPKDIVQERKCSPVSSSFISDCVPNRSMCATLTRMRSGNRLIRCRKCIRPNCRYRKIHSGASA